MHAAPPTPHALALGGVVHVAPEQQPLAQVVVQAAHAPLTHALAPHASHAPPPLPHAVGTVPAAHVVPLQQPAHER